MYASIIMEGNNFFANLAAQPPLLRNSSSDENSFFIYSLLAAQSGSATVNPIGPTVSQEPNMTTQSLLMASLIQRLQSIQNLNVASPAMVLSNTPVQTSSKMESPMLPFLIQGLIRQDPDQLKLFTTNYLLHNVPTPDWTPSPTLDSSCSSPTASASTNKSHDKEENDEDLYIDVEDVDEKICGKVKRKAHVEFYRKLKSIRTREKLLQCSMCDSTVENNDHSVMEHVNGHAGGLCYRCMVCGWETSQKTHIYAHMKEKHPKKPKSFVDRRDMTKLCNLITDCFPRNGSRTKIGYTQFLDKFVKSLKERAINKVKCKLCNKSMFADRLKINKHIHSHPAYRCKVCKFTSETLEQQSQHCLVMHQIQEPKATVDYNLCSAADVLVQSFQKCFAHYLD